MIDYESLTAYDRLIPVHHMRGTNMQFFPPLPHCYVDHIHNIPAIRGYRADHALCGLKESWCTHLSTYGRCGQIKGRANAPVGTT